MDGSAEKEKRNNANMESDSVNAELEVALEEVRKVQHELTDSPGEFGSASEEEGKRRER